MRYAMGFGLYDPRVSRALRRSGGPTPPATVNRVTHGRGGARGAGARDGMKWLDARLCSETEKRLNGRLGGVESRICRVAAGAGVPAGQWRPGPVVSQKLIPTPILPPCRWGPPFPPLRTTSTPSLSEPATV